MGSSKLSKIPERIQQAIYEYIKDGAYFPRKYLTTFQISRLNFEFYGATKNLTDEQSAMLLAFLLLSVVASQKILCNIRETVKQYKDEVNVLISSKYVAAILHYLVKETFKKDIESLDDIYALFNYYRNYHIDNEFIEKSEIKDISKEDYEFEGLPNVNEDEYSKFFTKEEEIEDFFSMNESFVSAFKNYIFIWALKLAKLIKEKFSKKDPTLLPRKPLAKPEDKIFNPDEVKEDKKEENNEQNEENDEKKDEKKEEKKKYKRGKRKETKKVIKKEIKIEDKKDDKKEIKIEEKEDMDKDKKVKKKIKKKVVKTTNQNGEEKMEYKIEVEEEIEEEEEKEIKKEKEKAKEKEKPKEKEEVKEIKQKNKNKIEEEKKEENKEIQKNQKKEDKFDENNKIEYSYAVRRNFLI